MRYFHSEHAFTLIELLVVIAIIAVIATATILVINPAELIKQGRDSTRLSDLNNINRSLGFLQVDQPDTSFGSSSVVYVSIPDTSSTCANLGLASLPAGWAYACATDVNHRKTDGNGWIPADFTSFSAGSPLSVLPIDPINTTSTGNYYTYVTGGSWEMTALFESSKHTARAANDGGPDPAQYETGTDLTIAPFTHGLVGWWKFEETSGSTAYDSSGWGNDAGMYSNGVATLLTTGTNCRNGRCASCDGIDNMIRAFGTASSPFNIYPGARTIITWINRTANAYPVQQAFGGGIPGNFTLWGNNTTAHTYQDGPVQANCGYGSLWSDDIWKHLAVIQNRDTSGRGYLRGYVDGVAACSATGLSISSHNGTYNDFTFCARQSGTGNFGNVFFNGLLDEVRIYNRALSAAEIQAIYNATN